MESRRQNGDSLYEEICKWTRERTKHEVMAELGAAGVPCSAVMDTVDLFNDPHLKSRDFIKTVSHPTEGDLKLLGFAPIMSEHEVDYRPAPLLGEHTKEILSEDLDLGSEAVEQLITEGVVDQSPVDRTGIAKGSAPRS